MEYFEDKQKAGEFLRLTLKLIGQHNLVTNLVNITIFYVYAEGKNNLLNQAIDDIVRTEGTITPKHTKALFERFFLNADSHDQTGEVLKGLNKIVGELSLFFAGSMDDMSMHGRKMEDFSTQISQSHDYSKISEVVEKMLEETKALVSANQKAHSQIESTSNDIEALKTELKKVQQEAQTDTLTQIANRRGLDKALLSERLRVIENQSSGFSLMIIDVDRFKQINDTFGHLTGDNVLKDIAKILKKNVRGSDVPARIGGDEFCILMPQTTLSQAVTVAIKIKNIIDKTSWLKKGGAQKLDNVTLSIGIAQYRFDESDEELIKRADQALYLAKESGRNAVKTEKDRSNS